MQTELEKKLICSLSTVSLMKAQATEGSKCCHSSDEE